MVYISYMSSVCRHTKDRKGEEGRRKRGRVRRGEGREEGVRRGEGREEG